MGRSRSRSRSQRRGGDERKSVADATKGANNEQEIVSVAIKQLPTEIRERLEKLFEEGLLKEGDLDLRSITVFASLNEGLQARVMNHMESERIYVANARSKSGFLIATCDKAKTGCLDARGLGAIDPWRTALVAMATPKQKILELKPERDWIDQHDEGAVIKIQVNLGTSVEGELGVPSVTVELPLTETSAAIKAKLVAMGVKSIKQNKMKLNVENVGFLKECHTFAYYNLEDNAACTLSEAKRGGARLRADHTVMPKRPKTQTAPPPAADEKKTEASPLDAIKANAPKLGLPASLPKLPGMTGPGGLPGLPGMPALPGLPGLARPTLPGMPALPGLPGLGGTTPGAALGKAGGLMPGLLGGAGMPGLLGGTMPGLGDAAKAKAPMLPLGGDGKAAAPGAGSGPGGLLGGPGGLPGLPAPGQDPKAAALAFMAKMGGAAPPGGAMSGPAAGAMGAFGKGGGMPGMPGMPMPKMGDAGGSPPGLAPPMGMPSMGATPKGASPAS